MTSFVKEYGAFRRPFQRATMMVLPTAWSTGYNKTTAEGLTALATMQGEATKIKVAPYLYASFLIPFAAIAAISGLSVETNSSAIHSDFSESHSLAIANLYLCPSDIWLGLFM